MINIGAITPEVLKAALHDTASKSKLREEVQTKIEEYREWGTSTIDYDAGVVQGLQLALDIIEES